MLPIMGITFNTFTPVNALGNFAPNPTIPINPETHVLLACTSGFFASLAFVNIYLLAYRPNDLLVWKGLIAGTLLQDLFMVGGFLTELASRGGSGIRLADWSGQDWGNVVGYSVIALLRGLFIAGVGLGEDKVTKRL